MDLKKFAREITSIMPHIHMSFIRIQPNILTRGKITFPQVVIMDILRLHRESKMSDIARALGVTKSAVTGLTDRLIRSGFLTRTRSLKDRRVVKIKLTRKGANLASRLVGYKLKILEKLFSDVSPRERVQYLKIMRKLYKNAKAGQGVPSDA